MKVIRHYLSATIVGLLLIVGATAQEELTQNEETATTTLPTPVVEPAIKLVHVLNPGEREYLSPNLIGVQNIAMTFLPLSINFVNVIDAYREIVNGVRYEIILNGIDTKAKNEDIICRLVILEKPWLRTEWGDKYRELVNTNCTDTEQGLADSDPAERSKVLNDKYPMNAIFNGGTRNELNDDEMARLESQIMPIVGGPNNNNNNKRQATTSTTTTTTTERTAVTTENVVAIEHELSSSSITTTTATPAINADDATPTAATDNQRNDAADDAADESATKPTELNDNEKQWLDEILSMGAWNFEKRIEQQKQQQQQQQNGPIANEAAAAAAEAKANEEVEEQHLSLAEESSNESKLPKAETDENVLETSTSTATQQQQPQQQSRAKRSSSDANLVGGTRSFSNEDAKEQLQASLDKLATGDGPNYKISQVFGATRQVVAGELTTIDAELIDADNQNVRCSVEIWSRAWLNDHQIKFKCGDKPAKSYRHSRSVENAEKKTHKKRNHHTLDKTEHLFHKFQIKFKRQYGSTMERQLRMRIFRQNLKTIEELNRNEMGSAKYGITEFADMTSTEYKQRTGLWQREANRPTGGLMAVVPELEGELPKEFDWRQKNAVSHVKNQGNCGSCWAFSVTGNIEGLYALKTGKLQEFSEQELLDCDTVDSACNGGLPDNAYKAIKEIGGLEFEDEYPYLAKKKQCQFNKTLSHVQVANFVDLPHNETAMQQWLIANGPISIGINANAMQFYRGGVSHPWKPLCSHTNLDHGVLIVGYGVSDYPNFHKTLPYWIVKNSWGPRWGEQGYYRVYRGDNTCGVSEMATSAVLA